MNHRNHDRMQRTSIRYENKVARTSSSAAIVALFLFLIMNIAVATDNYEGFLNETYQSSNLQTRIKYTNTTGYNQLNGKNYSVPMIINWEKNVTIIEVFLKQPNYTTRKFHNHITIPPPQEREFIPPEYKTYQQDAIIEVIEKSYSYNSIMVVTSLVIISVFLFLPKRKLRKIDHSILNMPQDEKQLLNKVLELEHNGYDNAFINDFYNEGMRRIREGVTDEQ